MHTALARKVLTTEYAVATLPFRLIESQVAGRLLPESSKVRLGLEKAIGTLDSAVGRLVGDDSLARRGSRSVYRADILEKATVLETKAERAEQAAVKTVHSGRAQAEQERAAATKRLQAEATTIREEQEARTRAAEERAEAAANAKAQQVERRAQTELRAVQDRAARQKEQIAKRTQVRTAKPKAQLTEATDLSRQAAKGRAAAERLGTLAQEQRAQRKGDA